MYQNKHQIIIKFERVLNMCGNLIPPWLIKILYFVTKWFYNCLEKNNLEIRFLNFVTVYVKCNVFKENNGSSLGVAMLSPLQILFIPLSLNFQFCRQYHILFLLIFIALIAFFLILSVEKAPGELKHTKIYLKSSCPFQLFFLFFLMKHFSI